MWPLFGEAHWRLKLDEKNVKRRLMIRFWLTFIFLFVLCSGNAQRKADSLFHAGKYQEAQVEYERLVFQGHAPVAYWLLKKSYCQKAQINYAAALETMKRVDLYNSPDSLQGRLFYEVVLLHYLHQQPDLALSRIQEWRYLQAAGVTEPFEIMEILSLAELGRWPEASQAFSAWSSKYRADSISNPLKDASRIKWRKVKKAEALSFVLPGSGQWYAGFPGRGMVSTGLSAGAVLFAIHQFSNGFFFSGAYTGVGLFYLFYWGGARYAVKLAEAKNREQKQALLVALHQAFDSGR
jgi:tetratricopeptide (TPR) repeat protein